MRPALATFGLGVALLLAAGAFDAEPLYVPGVAFVVLVAVAVGWVRVAARAAAITRTVGARTVVEDEPVAIDIAVRAGALGLPAGLVDDELLPEPRRIRGAGPSRALRLNARFARRGLRELAPPHLVLRDPFGLAERTLVAGGGPAEVLVLPRISDVQLGDGGGEGDVLGARRGRPWVAAEVDLDGVRPHRVGAPASRIVWPAFARSGELLERHLRADTDTRPLVVLDPRGAAVADDLDAAVRAAASLAVHLARRGGCAVLLPGDRRPTALEGTLAAWPRLHVRFALVDGASAPSVAGMVARRGPIFYVGARRSARPPRGLAHAPGGGRILVVPGALAGRPPAFRVAGCSGYELSAPRARAVA